MSQVTFSYPYIFGFIIFYYVMMMKGVLDALGGKRFRSLEAGLSELVSRLLI